MTQEMAESWQQFVLTNGDTIDVPCSVYGAAWEWMGQTSFEELGMTDVNGDYRLIRCTNDRADRIARQVHTLYYAQLTAADDSEREQLWEAFCNAD